MISTGLVKDINIEDLFKNAKHYGFSQYYYNQYCYIPNSLRNNFDYDYTQSLSLTQPKININFKELNNIIIKQMNQKHIR